MYTQAVLLSVLVAIAEARFGQEQTPIAAIQAVTSGGGAGVAATLAGGSIQFLLGAANPCGKLVQADAIIAQLGTGADALAAARGLVAAEQNFNPFATNIPSICSDPTLPKTEALRGVIPLIDPAVTGSDLENANSVKSLTTPFASAGLSVADIMVAQGFSNFTTKSLDGIVGKPGGAVQAPAPVVDAPVVEDAPVIEAPAETPAAEAPVATIPAGCPTTLVTVTRAATAAPVATEAPVVEAPPAVEEPAVEEPVVEAPAGGDAGASPFGTCDPTIKFVGGLGGRPATEFTFQSNDATISAVQQEALNPNIITNRICDQLTNTCGASAAGKATCLAAKATILAGGKRDATVVDAWKTALGL